MNQQKLAQLNAQNRAAQIYFATFSQRTRALPQTTIQDVIDVARRQNVTVAPVEVEAFFEALEEADCGQFVRDEAGTFFRWVFRSTQVSRVARQHSAAAQEALAALAPAPAPLETIAHQWRGRPDWTLNLELPPDFSLNEAKRLCHFVMSLPLEADAPEK